MKLSNARKALYVLSWIPPIVFKTVAAILGLLVVPIALAISGDRDGEWPRWLWIWGNDEQGPPDWWLNNASNKWYTRHWPRFWWYAVRNPVNNMRLIFEDREAAISGNWTEPQMEAQDLLDRNMRVAYRWSYNGPFAGYRRVWLNDKRNRYSEFWLGWKVGSVVPGMGFAMQYRRDREIGK